LRIKYYKLGTNLCKFSEYCVAFRYVSLTLSVPN
jgi:hypothetical protein